MKNLDEFKKLLNKKKLNSTDDEEYWNNYIRGVKALDNSNVVDLVSHNGCDSIRVNSFYDGVVLKTEAAPIKSPQKFDTIEVDCLVSNIHYKLLKKIRRGLVSIDGSIDLHGFTREEAWKNLFAFIKYHVSIDSKVVLVITGRGLRENGGVGVLRANLPSFLGMQAVRDYIIGFGQASDNHGGLGAFYVLLKRK